MPATPSGSQMGVPQESQPLPDAACGPPPHSAALRFAVTSFLRDRRGVTAIEYGLMLGLMTLVIVSAIYTLGTQTFVHLFSMIASSI